MNHLNESDLLEVYESVFHARARWYRIGRELNIPSGELDVHREQSHNDALREVLHYWLRQTNPAPTMDKLKEAVLVAERAPEQRGMLPGKLHIIVGR